MDNPTVVRLLTVAEAFMVTARWHCDSDDPEQADTAIAAADGILADLIHDLGPPTSDDT